MLRIFRVLCKQIIHHAAADELKNPARICGFGLLVRFVNDAAKRIAESRSDEALDLLVKIRPRVPARRAGLMI